MSSKQKTLSEILNDQIESDNITATDAETIFKYVSRRQEMGKIKTDTTARKHIHVLCALRKHKMMPEYSQLTTDAVFACLRLMPKVYGQNSIRENWNIIKTFVKYGQKNKLFAVDMEALKEYTAPAAKKDSVKYSDILSDADYNRMIDVAQTPRDKALIAVMAETGCRPKEITTLLWSDVTFTGRSVMFSLIDAKKPEVRKTAFVTKRVSYLVDLQKSQASDSIDMPVFRITLNNTTTKPGRKAMSVQTIRYVLKAAAAAAGVRMPRGASCKLLRASSVTNKLKAGVPPVAIMKSHWSAGAASKMFDHYEKLAGIDTEAMMLSADGQPVDNRPAKADAAAVGWICIKDGHVNPAGAKFCQECGSKPDAVKDDTEARLAEMEAKYARMVEMNEKLMATVEKLTKN